MSRPTADDVEAKLDRASDATGDDERRLLREARDDLDALRGDAGDVESDRLDELEARVDRRLRALEERDEYGGSDAVGAPMHPDEDDAP